MDRSLPSPARWASPTPSCSHARHGAGRARPGWRAALAAAWHRLTMDTDERFLRDACDLVDLERRLRVLERGGRAHEALRHVPWR